MPCSQAKFARDARGPLLPFLLDVYQFSDDPYSFVTLTKSYVGVGRMEIYSLVSLLAKRQQFSL